MYLRYENIRAKIENKKKKRKTNYIQIEIYKRYQRNARKFACELCACPRDQSLLYMCVTLQDYTECASDTWNVRPETFICRLLVSERNYPERCP